MKYKTSLVKIHAMDNELGKFEKVFDGAYAYEKEISAILDDHLICPDYEYKRYFGENFLVKGPFSYDKDVYNIFCDRHLNLNNIFAEELKKARKVVETLILVRFRVDFQYLGDLVKAWNLLKELQELGFKEAAEYQSWEIKDGGEAAEVKRITAEVLGKSENKEVKEGLLAIKVKRLNEEILARQIKAKRGKKESIEKIVKEEPKDPIKEAEELYGIKITLNSAKG